ncbi:hypothetical protein HOA92_04840 [archaeon]|nr:hypothetical protein [archaeon]MBT6762344.1 hypothetical protein [archaeon]
MKQKGQYISKGQGTPLATSIDMLYENLPGLFGSKEADFGLIFTNSVLHGMSNRQIRWGNERAAEHRTLETAYQKDLRFILFDASHQYLPGVGKGNINEDLSKMNSQIIGADYSDLLSMTHTNTPEGILAILVGSGEEVIHSKYKSIGKAVKLAANESRDRRRSEKNFLEYRDINSALAKLRGN